jgi:hypothetical protein
MEDPMEEARKKIEELSAQEKHDRLDALLTQLADQANAAEKQQAGEMFQQAMEDDKGPAS